MLNAVGDSEPRGRGLDAPGDEIVIDEVQGNADARLGPVAPDDLLQGSLTRQPPPEHLVRLRLRKRIVAEGLAGGSRVGRRKRSRRARWPADRQRPSSRADARPEDRIHANSVAMEIESVADAACAWPARKGTLRPAWGRRSRLARGGREGASSRCSKTRGSPPPAGRPRGETARARERNFTSVKLSRRVQRCWGGRHGRGVGRIRSSTTATTGADPGDPDDWRGGPRGDSFKPSCANSDP